MVDVRSALLAAYAPDVLDLGAVERNASIPSFAGRAVIDVDAQEPAPLAPAALAPWAAATGVTIVAVVPWALALPPPHANGRLAHTHARECEMANARSWMPAARALADAFAIVETRIAPCLPLGATRRALLVLEPGADERRTAATIAGLDARRASLRGRLDADALLAAVPDARELAADLARTAGDFRAFAYLAKLAHAAVMHGAIPLPASLIAGDATAQRFTDTVERLERDRALFAFAYGFAADPAVQPLVTHRGVRLDDVAIRLLLRRNGHPGYRDE